MKNLLFLLGILLLTIHCKAQTFVDLEKLEISNAQQSYGSPVKNVSVIGENISIAGQSFNSGNGIHANSTIKLKLPYQHKDTIGLPFNKTK